MSDSYGFTVLQDSHIAWDFFKSFRFKRVDRNDQFRVDLLDQVGDVIAVDVTTRVDLRQVAPMFSRAWVTAFESDRSR